MWRRSVRVIDVSQKTDATMKKCPRHCGLLSAGSFRGQIPQAGGIYDHLSADQFHRRYLFHGGHERKLRGRIPAFGVQSSINDGLLDVIIFKEMNFMELLPLAINVLQGRHDENKM